MYCVSFKLRGGVCGNRTFDTISAAEAYIVDMQNDWTSATLYSYDPHPSGISELSFVRRIKPEDRQPQVWFDPKLIMQAEF